MPMNKQVLYVGKSNQRVPNYYNDLVEALEESRAKLVEIRIIDDGEYFI